MCVARQIQIESYEPQSCQKPSLVTESDDIKVEVSLENCNREKALVVPISASAKPKYWDLDFFFSGGNTESGAKRGIKAESCRKMLLKRRQNCSSRKDSTIDRAETNGTPNMQLRDLPAQNSDHYEESQGASDRGEILWQWNGDWSCCYPSRWNRKQWKLFSWAVAACIVTATTFFAIYFDFQQTVRDTTEGHCQHWAYALNDELSASANQVRVYADVVATLQQRKRKDVLDQSLFDSLAIKIDHPHVLFKGMTFSPLVKLSSKASYESTNNLNCIRDSDRLCERDNDNFAPVQFTSGFNNTTLNLIGIDVLSVPSIASTALKVRTNFSSPGVMSRIVSLPFLGIQRALVQVEPVRVNTSSIYGLLLAYYDISILWDEAFLEYTSRYRKKDLIFWIYDAGSNSNNGGPSVLYQSHLGKSSRNSSKQHTFSSTVHFGDAVGNYEMRCRRDIDDNKFPMHAVYLSVAVLGLFLLVSYYVFSTSLTIHRLQAECSRMEILKEQMRAAKTAAEAASKAKGTFLATMSHEIRTPMNGVIGMMNLLLQTSLDATQLDYVETARTSGRALCSLINDILDLSKIEAGRMELEETGVDLRAEVDDVLSMFGERTRKKPQVEVAAFIHNEVPETIVGDSLRFRQVLINLLSNSCKFTSTGHIFIVIRVAAPDEAIETDGCHFADEMVGPEGTGKGGEEEEEEEEEAREGRGTDRSCFELSDITRNGGPGYKKLQLDAGWGNGVPQGRGEVRGGLPQVQCGNESLGPAGGIQLEGGGWLSLSGRETVESCNSWHRIRDSVDPEAVGMRGARTRGPRREGVVRLVVSVEDTGQGIPADSQDRLFKPFVQADISTTRTHGGTGIGLSISQHLVSLMGGRLGFVSSHGVGTTFFFDMNVPVMEEAGGGGLLGAFGGGGGEDIWQDHVAIVVDHKPVRAAVTANVLQRLQLESRRVGSFQEAAELLPTMFPLSPDFRGPVVLAASDTVEKSGELGKNWKEVLRSHSDSHRHAREGMVKGEILDMEKEKEGVESMASWRAVLLSNDTSMEDIAQQSGYDAMLLKPFRKANVAGCLTQVLSVKPAKQSIVSSTLSMVSAAADFITAAAAAVVESDEGEPVSQQVKGRVNCSNDSRVGKSSVGREADHSPSVLEGAKKESSSVVEVSAEEKHREELVSPENLSTSQLLGRALKGKKFLVVDDNMVNRKVIQKMLQRYSVDVVAVVGGAQSIEKMKPGHAFDCVLMDIQMPGMDGFESTRRIREQEIENVMKHTPIVALTADIFFGTKEKAIESGMDEFLSKPIEEEQLWAVIQKFFKSELLK